MPVCNSFPFHSSTFTARCHRRSFHSISPSSISLRSIPFRSSPPILPHRLEALGHHHHEPHGVTSTPPPPPPPPPIELTTRTALTCVTRNANWPHITHKHHLNPATTAAAAAAATAAQPHDFRARPGAAPATSKHTHTHSSTHTHTRSHTHTHARTLTHLFAATEKQERKTRQDTAGRAVVVQPLVHQIDAVRPRAPTCAAVCDSSVVPWYTVYCNTVLQ